MIKKLKTLLLVAVTASLFGAPLLAPALAEAATGVCGNATVANGIATGVGDATGSTDCGNGTGSVTSGIQSVAKTAVNIFSIIVGVVAVVMIIYGGFRYITSGGDSGKVGSAKNTLIYAIIGLVIVALAQLIVHYVLTQSNSISTPSGAAITEVVDTSL